MERDKPATASDGVAANSDGPMELPAAAEAPDLPVQASFGHRPDEDAAEAALRPAPLAQPRTPPAAPISLTCRPTEDGGQAPSRAAEDASGHKMNQSSSSDDERDWGHPQVEVIFPTQAAAEGFVDDGVTGPRVCEDASGSGNVDGVASLVAKALADLPPELVALAQNPKNHAKSKDPGWKYGFWPNEAEKDKVQCIFCKKIVPAGIKRFKQHLAGGYGDAEKCSRAPAIIRKEMNAYLNQNSRTSVIAMEESEGEAEPVAPATVPSSGTKAKQNRRKATAQAQASIASFVGGQKKHTKSTKEAKQIVDDHVADFFYENGIPLNAINSRSWEVLLESIGQYGPGYRSPYHEMRNPLLERAVEKTNELRKKHEEAWKEYGCTLMSDGWTDQRHRHLINFLANSPAGTFFLGSVDASSEVANASMLADLLEKQIEQIGKEYVVQVVTDNGANFKAAGRILMERIPTLFWTPCAAHCLDLLLEDLGKIKQFNMCINNAKKVCRFLYKHGRLLDQMRDKLGGDLVRPAVTRFATSYLTLASMYKHRQGLKTLFVSQEWQTLKVATSAEGKAAERLELSMPFWNQLEMCLKASQPILFALRIADGDETPAVPEIMAAMDLAKKTINNSLKDKPQLLNEVIGYFEKRWDNQMEQKLYGAALFLNPAKFFQ
ncbi:hypothetical protein PR202_ga30030 [Eleusine coracana subsp. coracana]|uniref:DUF659 domain-containing protein n=1 Tax=Eleusine coracana subsp. coracana TaxID=191504 RepID=A0AAV5DMU5_ELECO|nr:hypothetical protein PR202_ga30015 [Eleusine coracana subsp. coracana]GJN11806.1 hypothetical protein PR202_ga30030 [Eleusine coracana subsp. coracana]